MTIECEHGQLARACNICEYEREIAEKDHIIAVLHKQVDDLKAELKEQIAALKAKHEGDLDEVEARGKTIARLGDKFSRLTTLIQSSDERLILAAERAGANEYFGCDTTPDWLAETVIESLKADNANMAKLNDTFPEEIARLEDEIAEKDKAIKILELKNKSSLANNLCPDHRDKQAGKLCLACGIEKRDQVIAELKDQYPAALKYCPAHRTIGVQIKERTPCCIIDALEAKLSRLTAALKDNERAEKVAEDVNMSDGGLIIPRMEGINDFREMLKEEMEK